MDLKYSKFRVKPTVVNGQPATRLEHPYLVSIKEPVYSAVFSRVWVNLCGGTIISELKVLTAAHCFEENNFYYKKHPEILTLVAGHIENVVNDTRTLPTAAQYRKISEVKINSGFHFPTNDIAVLFVKVPWVFSRTVDYLPYAKYDIDYRRRCQAVGFGRTGHKSGRMSRVLLKAYLYLLTKAKCTFMWRINMDKFICTDSVFSDVSNGDSGGPLVCRKTGDPAENARGVLVGVVSGKNYDKTTLFTRVAKFSNWIETGASSKLSSLVWLNIIIVFVYLVSFFFNNLDSIESLAISS